MGVRQLRLYRIAFSPASKYGPILQSLHFPPHNGPERVHRDRGLRHVRHVFQHEVIIADLDDLVVLGNVIVENTDREVRPMIFKAAP